MLTSHPAFKSTLLAGLLVLGSTVIAATQWRTVPAQSTLGFSGTQAGAPFNGVFERFTADIRFDPKDLATSRLDVTIDVKSVNSKDKDRDTAIRSADFFAADRWPTARYVAERLTDKGGGRFGAVGKLTVRDVTRDVPIDFTFATDASGGVLKGTAAVKRLDFGVGQGDWKDTAVVGNEVKISFTLKLGNGATPSG